MVQYVIRYTVAASTRLDAITAATKLLRTNVKVNGVVSAEPTDPGFWVVRLHVTEEDE